MAHLAINGGPPVRKRPFPSWPVWDDRERKSVQSVIDSGKWGYPNGECVSRFEKNYAAYHDARFGVCFNSGTSALMGALWAVGVQPGDEVIVPAYTFVATASAVFLIGAYPVFADIEAQSLNISAQSVDEHCTKKTKAVIAVHIGGRPANMDQLNNVCRYRGLALIEDAAQAWGAEWQNRRVGAIGDAGVFSFHASKNITAGEGGIVVSDDEEIARYCRCYCNCGRHEDKPRYVHYCMGGNFRMNELQGAILMAQFERYPKQLKLRQGNAVYLERALGPVSGITPINTDESVTAHSYHFFLMRYDSSEFGGLSKSRMIEMLQAEGIPAHPGYTLPVYKQPVFVDRLFGARGREDTAAPDYGNLYLPETERACSEEAVWLSQNVLLGSQEDMQDIAEAFGKVKKHADEQV